MRKVARRFFPISLFLLVASPLWGEEPDPRPETSASALQLRIYDYARLPQSALTGAKETTAKIFAAMELRIRWLDCYTAAVESNSACDKALGPNEIALRILSRSKPLRRSTGDITGAIAYRVDPRGGSGFISVYWDRIIVQARLVGLSPGLVMGHVMAHELGHILLPEVGHSRRGIMQVRLSNKDCELASWAALRFTLSQAQTIRAGIAARSLAARVD